MSNECCVRLNRSSKVSCAGATKNSWVVIGGERGSVGHVGLGYFVIGREEGKRRPCLPKYERCQSWVTSPEAEVKTAEAEVKMSRGVF